LVRLQANLVVNGISEALLAPEVTFGRLDTDVTEQKLYLLEFAAGFVAPAGTSPPKIVRRDSFEPASGAGCLHDGRDANLAAEFRPDEYGRIFGNDLLDD
jgi:hypothetical protein